MMKHWYIFDAHACYHKGQQKSDTMRVAKQLHDMDCKDIEIRFMSDEEYQTYCETGVRTQSGQ